MPSSASYSWYGSDAPRAGTAPHAIGGNPVIDPLPLEPDEPDEVPEAPEEPGETVEPDAVDVPDEDPDSCCRPVLEPLDVAVPDAEVPGSPEKDCPAASANEPLSASSPFGRWLDAQPITEAKRSIVARLVLIFSEGAAD